MAGADVRRSYPIRAAFHDAERLARFEREARALARLKHPDIASIHGVEEAGDVRALVLELVEGETLEAMLTHGVPSTDRCLDIAVALADVVAAAHAQGITHRDLKPSDVMVRSDGRIKVLDFTASGRKPHFLADSRRLVYEDGGRLWIVDVAARRSRELFAFPGAGALKDPALAPGDTAIYFVRARQERDIWLATLR